ncbi:pyrimidine-nucleoside phosphorylase [Dethiosulfovibrio peptidovorans DSM 11002]|uniref:Pyrimidine-nucleoside phosphorylase n=1 Tax=Dethiosulfovibrio peptidovorans DSM 11002 TaxID=469381 RepID=D2Z3Z9_9BACT|nr:thymidine phosphorylase [Dethiosulfovibrio peptidovorans]EFC92260.1 pyrimidine-nucleoside phosphorylase [Dethiosulfovibrio peptidovorans DSM 11002]
MFDVLRFIETKRDRRKHDKGDIEAFVTDALTGQVREYHVAAWLMAVYLNGMEEDELLSFTSALAESGKRVSFPKGLNCIDKHSTGGVGDKTSMVLVPLVASCGVPVAKLSGRGLGFTGGTVDKLESIPGFRVDMSLADFSDQVERIGCAIAGHSHDLAPAEALFYELRDVTSTVQSVPLICSSIVSKKIAGGASGFVFDVKYGSGALMESIQDAEVLAKSLVDVSDKLGFPSSALITSMEQPLGRWVGNSMEVFESMEVLRGGGPEDTVDLCLDLAGEMIFQGGRSDSPDSGRAMARNALDSGAGLRKFADLVKEQGGTEEVISHPERYLKHGPMVHEVKAEMPGFIHSVDTKSVGEAVRRIGGGRMNREDQVDPGAAIEIMAGIGDSVTVGQPLMRLYCNDRSLADSGVPYVTEAFSIREELPEVPKLVQERIGR